MTRSVFNYSAHGVITLILAGLLLAGAQAQDMPKMGQMPKRVMDGLKAKFPNFNIEKWTEEKEDKMIVYDIEFTQGGQKFEADVKEDGTIHNWEKAIPAKDLPRAVKKAVNRRYPKTGMTEIMEITAVKEGNDKLEGYEIVLRIADKKDVEVTVAPNGKILEDSGSKK
jgi:uncharacterized membrane protein YkoI